jgi:flagellin
MRAQIGGLTQASKNAEDGISMVQTFEGALQETDSILQRMRTLAVQSANGTYQDDVDRDAIQLEFDQLNDELNQIADTDFNGVIVLNGGEMADGTRAVNNKFDYTNNTRNEKQLGPKDVQLVDEQVINNSSTDAKSITKSDEVWQKLFTNVDRKNATTSDDGPESFEVTLQYDATATSANDMWKITGATEGADTDQITITGTDNGGFKLTTNSVDWANVVVDQSSLKNGDTITLTYNNPAAAISAPTNAGAKVADSNLTAGTDENAVKPSDADLGVELNAAITSDKMTESLNKAYEALNGADVKVTYTANNSSVNGTNIKVNMGGNDITSAGVVITLGDKQLVAKLDSDTVKLYDATKVADAKDENLLMTLSPTTGTAATNGTTGDITYKLGVENNAYDTSKQPSVEVKKPDDAAVSKSNSWDQSKAKMTYADSMTLQVGARTKDSVNFTFEYNTNDLGGLKANMNCSAREDGLNTANLSLKTAKDANAAIDQIDKALNKTNMVRATFGAIQNRLEHKISNLDTNAENMTAAESRIRDTQMDKEMMKFTSSQILSQASQSMLAQANSLPQGVLQLLG